MKFNWYNKPNGRGRNYSFATEMFRPKLCDFTYSGESYTAEFGTNSGGLTLTNWDVGKAHVFDVRSRNIRDAERMIRGFLNGNVKPNFSYDVD